MKEEEYQYRMNIYEGMPKLLYAFFILISLIVPLKKLGIDIE